MKSQDTLAGEKNAEPIVGATIKVSAGPQGGRPPGWQTPRVAGPQVGRPPGWQTLSVAGQGWQVQGGRQPGWQAPRVAGP